MTTLSVDLGPRPDILDVRAVGGVQALGTQRWLRRGRFRANGPAGSITNRRGKATNPCAGRPGPGRYRGRATPAVRTTVSRPCDEERGLPTGFAGRPARGPESHAGRERPPDTARGPGKVTLWRIIVIVNQEAHASHTCKKGPQVATPAFSRGTSGTEPHIVLTMTAR